ncbi:MAG TPA: FAD:protein FMN transferase, partial [Candidatus Udaeobacter sp.]|nr:FAD:protein FMN transferase [Candidatus Udaeobacter sp.]
DLGGQWLVVGTGDSVRVELADPRARARPVASVAIASGSLSTSGQSERGVTVDGARIGHVLDPRTGQPARDFGSLTVWAETALAADCLSTGLYVLGPDSAFAWAARTSGVDVVVLEPTPARLEVRATPGIAARITAIAPEARVDGPRTSD